MRASTSGLMRMLTCAVRPRAAASCESSASSASDSTLKQRMPVSSPKRQLRRRLADAGEHDLLRRHAGGERAPELALRHHVGAGAEPRQRGDDRLVGIGLQRVADQVVEAGERLVEDAVVPRQRGGRIAIERRADRRRDRRHGHVLGVQHAIPVREMVHGEADPRAGSRGRTGAWPEAPAGAAPVPARPEARRDRAGRCRRSAAPARSARSPTAPGSSSEPRRPQPETAMAASSTMMSARIGMDYPGST